MSETSEVRRRQAWRDLWSLPLHPIGIAAFAVLFLFAENVVEQVSIGPLWVPLAVAIAAGAATTLLAAALLRDWLRGALLASLLLALFFSFGHAWNLLNAILDGRRYLVAAWLAVALAGGLAIWRGGRWVRPVTTFANLAVMVLVVFNVARIGGWVLESSTATKPPVVAPSFEFRLPREEQARDIYYLVFDRYANVGTLRDVYGFDNEPFLRQLEDRGFTIARDSWSNYFKTAFSLYSSLSMDFIMRDSLGVSIDSGFGPVHRALGEELAAPSALQALGYEFVLIPSWWPPIAENSGADRILSYSRASEFATSLMETTGLSLLNRVGARRDEDQTFNNPTVARAYTDYGFEAIHRTTDQDGPTFVLAHMLVPHPPYVFDVTGEPLPADLPETEAYIRQLQWTNARILEVVDRLLDVPEGERPVIILQADEGPYPARYVEDQRAFEWLEASPEEVAQKFGILNAFYLPGVDPVLVGVHDRISPVNAFRIILNAYFDADLPLLPDVSYHSPNYDRLYDFIPARDLPAPTAGGPAH